MNKELKDKLKGTLIVPVGLSVVLVPFSILIGWNFATLVLFWFMITPGLAIYLPTIVSLSKNHLFESLAGLIIFYAIMVFMIYDHHKSDYFQVMMVSFVINLILVSLATWIRKRGTQIR
jgi:hypothetical protein